MKLSRLLDGMVVAWPRPGDADIQALTVDEREVEPGTLYVARRGYYGDGHDRIDAALAAGAAAVVVDDPAQVPAGAAVPVAVVESDPASLGDLSARFHGHPTARLQVYGVTGTNGKTSVTALIEHMLRALGERPAVMGTVNYRFGTTEHPAANTTPDALFVQRFARLALDAGATSLVLEVSSHGLTLGRSAGVQFDRVGFTNLSHEHLDFHGTMEAYGAAKARLFDDYLWSALERGKTPMAAACVDDSTGRTMLDRVPPGTPTLTVSAENAAGADIAIERIESLGSRGCRFQVTTAAGCWQGGTPLLGRYNLANIALAAALVGGHDARRWAAALGSMAAFPGIAGRLEPVAVGDGGPRAVFVDYAHSPDALERALAVLGAEGQEPVTVVVGCGGDRDRSKRALMGRAAQRGAHRVILTSDNPRSEDPALIIAEMQRGMDPELGTVESHIDRAAAIERAIRCERSGPVLIAGKGHERYQERDGVRYRFDDREEARRALVGARLGLESRQAPLIGGWTAQRLARVVGTDPTTAATWLASSLAAEAHDLLDSDAAARKLLEAIIVEARLRPDGLWTGWVVAAERPAAARLAASLAGRLPDEGSLHAPWAADPRRFAATVARLAPAQRGLVVELTADDARSEAVQQAAWLAPDLLVLCATLAGDAPRVASVAAAADAEPAWVCSEPELAATPAATLQSFVDRARRNARRRHHQRLEPRPIPVPLSLQLEPETNGHDSRMIANGQRNRRTEG